MEIRYFLVLTLNRPKFREYFNKDRSKSVVILGVLGFSRESQEKQGFLVILSKEKHSKSISE